MKKYLKIFLRMLELERVDSQLHKDAFPAEAADDFLEAGVRPIRRKSVSLFIWPREREREKRVQREARRQRRKRRASC